MFLSISPLYCTSVDWLLQTILGIELMTGILGLASFAAAYSLYGGLSAVAWTDIIQVVVLVLGGLVTTYLALDTVSGGNGFFDGLSTVFHAVPDRFDMILEKGHPEYNNLPGIGVLIGGMWIANLYYWGFNQYIIQRTLAAKSLAESQKGILFAAGLKMIIPIIVVIPGIAAYVIVNDPSLLGSLGDAGMQNMPTVGTSDKAFPWLMQFLPTGFKGIAIAALAAAIVSSLASMLNSTATIFTMDIYKTLINMQASETLTVKVGRLSAFVALIIATIMAPLLGGIDQAFQFIQEYTGIVSPGILAVFVMGLFWKKASNKGAIYGALASIPIAMFFKIGSKGWMAGSSIEGLFPILPFLDQMGFTAILSMVVIVSVSLRENRDKQDAKGIELKKEMFNTPAIYNIGAFTLMLVLVALYAFFW